jgi:hypothetical protein
MVFRVFRSLEKADVIVRSTFPRISGQSFLRIFTDRSSAFSSEHRGQANPLADWETPAAGFRKLVKKPARP